MFFYLAINTDNEFKRRLIGGGFRYHCCLVSVPAVIFKRCLYPL